MGLHTHVALLEVGEMSGVMLFWSRSVSYEDIVLQGICEAVCYSGRSGTRMERKTVLKEKNRPEQTEWGISDKDH